MTRHDIPWLSAAETAVAIKTRQVSPVEVVQAYLARIERLDEQLHAYITVLRDAALAAARQAEQTVLRGGDLGPLFGVPVAVKGTVTHPTCTVHAEVNDGRSGHHGA